MSTTSRRRDRIAHGMASPTTTNPSPYPNRFAWSFSSPEYHAISTPAAPVPTINRVDGHNHAGLWASTSTSRTSDSGTFST